MDGETPVHQGLSGMNGYRPVYAIFEGGGAKGITHIGALKALEYEQLAIAGVAGSSAGAIVAALAALGFKSNELFDPTTGTDILQPRTPVGVLGRGTWLRFGLIRRLLPALVVLAGLAVLAALLLVVMHRRAVFPLLALAIALSCIGGAVGLVWPVLIRRGLFDSRQLRSVLNDIFRAKLNEHLLALGQPAKPDDYKVRFADINPAFVPQCATLKIIVSDIRSGQLLVFDHNTPEVVLADAVAASASIPFAFQPPAIEGFPSTDGRSPIYVDGGLISNLPVWSFSAEKRSLERSQGGPPIPIIAFSLDGATGTDPKRQHRLTLWPYLVKVIQTGIFGSQKVVQRFVPDLVMIALRSPLDTMRFDCDRAEAIAAFDAGYLCASSELLRLRRTSEITTRVLESILAAVRSLVTQKRAAEKAETPRLRINLIDPIDDRNTAFRIVASVGMDRDADDRLELDSRNRIAPKAFRGGVAQFDIVRDLPASDLTMTKYEYALVCPRLHSVICLPIFTPGVGSTEPERVLCIDSTDDLQSVFSDSVIMDSLRDLSVAASRSLILRSTGVP